MKRACLILECIPFHVALGMIMGVGVWNLWFKIIGVNSNPAPVAVDFTAHFILL